PLLYGHHLLVGTRAARQRALEPTSGTDPELALVRGHGPVFVCPARPGNPGYAAPYDDQCRAIHSASVAGAPAARRYWWEPPIRQRVALFPQYAADVRRVTRP